jgi:outer membrane protein assembly factor BamB
MGTTHGAIRLSLFGAAGLAMLAAADWPRFRGPNGTGVALDKDVPLAWTEADGVLWKTPLPGLGNSSPIVCRGRVFLQTASADGAERHLVCVDVADGRLRWSAAAPGGRGRTHKLNSLASATPASDGERVYAAFWDGRGVALYAYDFDGKPQWERALGAFSSQHGAGTSPAVYGGRVYFANDQDGAATLYALDARTGHVVWEKVRKAFRASYATPFLLEPPDGPPELVVASTAGITSYEPATGSENWVWNWRFDGEPLRCVGSPLYCRGKIVVTSGDGSGDRCTVAVKAGGRGDVTATNRVWQTGKKTFPYVPSALASGDHLYFVSDKGFAVCVALESGEPVWSERLASGDFFASPVLVDGKVYAVSDAGTCYVFEAAPAFKLLARSDVGERVKATPAVADGRLFIRGETHLFCIGRTAAK